MTTTWHQYAPYNALSKANNYPTGCVTIAMAQIMRFFKHPANYNWSNMQDNTATEDTKILIRDVTQALGISHDSKSSDVSIGKAEDAFKSAKFRYNVIKKDHNYQDVQNSISRKEPVFMTGKKNVSDGHAWVCDGANRREEVLEYFVEYLSGTPGSFRYSSDGTPCLGSPYTLSRGRLSFHMNWGEPMGENNGWYDFTYDGSYGRKRENLYVTPK